MSAAALLDGWRRLGAQGTRPPRARDAAAALGVSEGALAEARRAAGEAVPLRRPEGPEGFAALLARLGPLGPLMALTRNDACVSEITGVYAAPTLHGRMAQTLGEIDLRLFLDHWVAAYAVTEAGRASLQVFDRSGEAVHKVFATDATNRAGWDALVAGLADPDAAGAIYASPPEAAPERPDAAVDAAGLREAWAALEHSHAFHGLLARFGVGRAQAMRLGGPAFARPTPADAARRLLEGAAARRAPLMAFVGNRGCVQIFSGPVARIEMVGPWLNVLDAGFNLHLRADRVAGAWVVRKPSLRGDVHSLELLDAHGGAILQLFGLREPGTEERADWRALLGDAAGGLPC